MLAEVTAVARGDPRRGRRRAARLRERVRLRHASRAGATARRAPDSDLVPHAPRLRAGGDYEFWSRSEWRDVRAAYGIDFAERRSMDPSLMYTAMEQGQVDVISAFSSDGRLAALDLVTLEDDRGAIPPYDAVVLVGRSLRRARPDVVAALGGSMDAFPSSACARSNLAVDGQGRSPSSVAEGLLRDLGSRGAGAPTR